MSSPRPSFLLVDGNNIIHAWPDLLKLHRRNPRDAHAELIRRLSEYKDFSNQRIVLVFDGRGARTNEERPSGGLQIFYSGAGETADDVIERLAIRYADAYEITVATNDRAEQDIVVGAGGEVLSSDGLLARLRANRGEMDDWLRRHRARN